ncbi:MAG: hypothetical protein R2826_06370 [Thermoleophilia bacterium]
MNTSLRREGGFLREVLWFALIVVVLAVVVLDGIALYGAQRSVVESAQTAAVEARTAYYQTQDVGGAELAAREYLQKDGKNLIAFDVGGDGNGNLVFSVTATAHATTYAFHYLKYFGLRDWVERTTDPETTQTAL